LKVLIVAHCYAPSSEIGAKRSTGLALELHQRDLNPVILTLKEDCILKTDPTRAAIPELEASTTRTRCRSIWHHTQKWRAAKNPLKKYSLAVGKFAAKLTRSLCNVDDLAPWSKQSANAGAKLAVSEKVDLIWATVPYIANSMLAFEIHKRTNIPFVVDYRDLLDPDDQSEAMQQRRLVEREILEQCAGVSYVAPAQIVSLTAQHPLVQHKPSRLVYNFFDDSGAESNTPQNQEHVMVYGGSLYRGERRMAGLVSALANRKQQQLDPVLFEFYGHERDRNYLSNLAEQKGCSNSIKISAGIQQAEFDLRCRQATIQVLSVGHGRKHEETIPGKLYDYFRATRPILVLGPEGCDAGKMVEATNRGIAVDDDDVAGIETAIDQLIKGKNRHATQLDMTSAAVHRFSRGPIVDEMLDFFREIAA
jgi:hypothetical protein